MIPIDELIGAVESAGFGDLKTYASWQALSPEPPEGPRMMIARGPLTVGTRSNERVR